MKRELGKLLRKGRDKIGFSRTEVAVRIGISESYVGHLECDNNVHLSDDLKSAFEKLYKIRITKKLQAYVNRRSLRYYRKIRQSA